MNLDINKAVMETDVTINGIKLLDQAYSKVPEGQKYSWVVDRDGLTQVGSNRSVAKYKKDGTPYVTLILYDVNKLTYIIEYSFITYVNFEDKKQSIWLESKATLQN